jgi:hypothetical protein
MDANEELDSHLVLEKAEIHRVKEIYSAGA